jgi:carbonic anhydrase
VCRLPRAARDRLRQRLGDIFDVRVAGNVAGDDETASLEYAAEHLHVPLVVVMGHTHCGAVSAALEGGTLPGKLPDLMAALRPAVDQSAHEPGDRLDNAVRDNVVHVVEQLRAAKPVLSELVATNKLRIVGAVYSLDTGKVDWLPAAGGQ